MTGLDDAAERFAAALKSLEERTASLTASAGAAHARADGLAAERDGLRARIAELEDEIRGLRNLNQDAETRLDGVIAEIRTLTG